MLKLSDKLGKIQTALTAISTNVYHYKRPASIDGAIIWQEDSEDSSFHAGNHCVEQQIHGTIDYFTKTEFDSTCDDIQSALDACMCGWRLNSVQYEDDTGLIHYEWEFWAR